jgi:hypothetical protein
MLLLPVPLTVKLTTPAPDVTVLAPPFKVMVLLPASA